MLAAGFLAFASTDANLHSTRYLELPQDKTSVHRKNVTEAGSTASIGKPSSLKSLDNTDLHKVRTYAGERTAKRKRGTRDAETPLGADAGTQARDEG